MKCLHISKDCDFGAQSISIPYSQIKCIEHDFGPSFLRIYYLNKMVSGHTEADFDLQLLRWSMSNEEDHYLNIYQEIPQGE